MLGEALGIKTTDSEELVKKLTEFHVQDIIAATNEITKHQVKYLANMNVEIFISFFLLSFLQFGNYTNNRVSYI